jgi:hypothetical protein
MKIRASMVVFSHLSDIQHVKDESFNMRINFVKYIIMHCKDDLSKEIDPDELWDEMEKNMK